MNEAEKLDDTRLILDILSRPRMYSEEIESVRDLLMFIRGVYCGLHPHSGARRLDGFSEYLSQELRFGPETLALKPAVEVCGQIALSFVSWIRVRGGK